MPKQPSLAIVGMSCLFPGADGLDAYWANIRNGVDSITPVPDSHWNPDDYFDSDPKRPDFTYGKAGGFLSPFTFDPMKYGIPPNAIEATDTSQLLAMAVADAAMEDAGYGASREFSRDKVSVILGVTGALELVVPLGARLGHPAWRKAMLDAGVDSDTADDAVQRIADSYVDWQENSFPGLLGNVVAGRVSKHLNTGGTNCVVDAACASSLSAMHLAALELGAGKADMVVTGGVDTFNDIFMYMCFSKTPALSPTGHARPFDHEGDGTTLGEGVGLFVLKRLEDAERDNDRIYAVVRGIGSSSDGKGDAIYAPNAAGQQKALIEAYANAGVSPDSVELVEAHGTGTKRGDAVEVSALNDVYRATGREGSWCALGSVKSQIGHTKSAAGAAGIMKAALALHRKVLPPTVKVSKPQDAVAPASTPFYVNTEKRPWITNLPRRAGVSSFGFGGSNFHCVLEEHTAERSVPDWDGDTQILAWSAPDRPSLIAKLDSVPTDGSWRDLRDFAQQSRRDFNSTDNERLVIVVNRGENNLADAINTLRSENATLPKNVFHGSGTAAGKAGFIFPGQGTQYVGMLRDLACIFPEFNRVLREANDVFSRFEHTTSLSDRIYPHPAFDDETRKAQTEALTSTDVAQPAIGALSLAAFQTLRRFGLHADCTAGHSYGELTALCAAGALEPPAFLHLSATRGKLMASGEGDRGTMYAVRSSADEVREIIDAEKLDVVVANINAPKQVVISGATDAVARAAQAFKSRKVSGTPLPVAAAFHSALVAPAAKAFGEAVAGANLTPPAIPVYANTSGAAYPANLSDAANLLANQLANPVEFVRQIEAMYNDGVRTFIEVGPGGRMSNLVRDILKGHDDVTTVALDASNGKSSGIHDLASMLARVAAAGHAVDLSPWDESHTPAPAQNGKPRMTVNISGANYRTPKKARPAAPRKSLPQPVETNRPAAPTPVSATRPQNGPPSESKRSVNGETAHNVKPPHAPHPPQPAPASGDLGALMRTTQEQIAALQRMQEQTAQLHRQFLEGQEQTARTYADLIARQRQLGAVPQTAPAAQQAPQSVPPTPAPTPQPVPPVAQPAPAPLESSHPEPPAAPVAETAAALFAIVAEKTGYPDEMLEAGMTLDADLGIDSIKRVEILSAMQERFPELPTIEAERLGEIQTLQDILDTLGAVAADSTPVSDAPAQLASHAILLEVVSEKTGYPVETLELSMTLDADLGIDSIKRVEILSAMQERLPELPSIDAERLGEIQTLQDILDTLGELEPGSVSVAPEAAAMNTSDEIPDGVRNLLMEVVSDKTGYPKEMLELEMSLDADLGIDSIKRVEILSAMQEAMPNLPQVEAEALGNIQTLQDVLNELADADPAPAASPEVEPAAPQLLSDPCEPLMRWIPTPVSVTPPATPTVALRGEYPVRVTDDGSEFAPALVDALRKLELKAELVKLNNASPADRLEGLIIVAPEQEAGETFLADAALAAGVSKTALAGDSTSATSCFATVTRMDGAFGLKNAFYPSAAVAGGLSGLAKTAAHEWSDVHVRALDVANDFDNAHAAADAVVKALLLEGPVEIGVSKAGMHVLELAETPLTSADDHSPAPFDGGVILVTGGARGVTAGCVQALSSVSNATVVLLGRSPWPVDEPAVVHGLDSESEIKRALHAHDASLSPRDLNRDYQRIASAREISRSMEALQSHGNMVEYCSVDVTDAAAVARTINDIRHRRGTITGLVHGAGVLADRSIDDLSAEDIHRVLHTKISGLRNLLDALPEDELNTLVLFSSSTARFGRTGQAAYAMANEALNKIALAHAARHPQCKVRSLNWGPWDGGMVTPALRKVFEAEGVGIIGLQSGARQFVAELSSDDNTVEVVLMGPGTRLPGAKAIRQELPQLPVACEFNLDVDSHPVLRSHVIDGKAVAPVAVYIEWMAHGALHGNPGLRFHGVDDLRVLKGIVLERDQSLALRVHAGQARRGEDGHFHIPVELQTTGANGAVRHAGATVVLTPQLQKSDARLQSMDLSVPPRYRKPVYETGALFHGKALHGIAEVEGCSDTAIRCVAHTAPRPNEWIATPLRRSWLADPLVLDSAFQAMILWSFENQGACSLPVHFGSYRQFEPFFTKGRIRIEAHVRESTPNRARADIEFTVANTGVLVARIEGYECIVDASLNDAFKRNSLETSRSHA